MSKSLGNVIDPMDVIHGASLEVLCCKFKLENKTYSFDTSLEAPQFPPTNSGVLICINIY